MVRLPELVSTTKNYTLSVSSDELIAIMRKDTDAVLSGQDRIPESYPLYKQIENLDSVTKVDYDGHYGPYIFFSVEETRGTDLVTSKKVAELIDEYLRDFNAG